MAYSYFNLYKKYYDSLTKQESIVENANSLVSLCDNSLRQINSTYFDKINDSKWEELGKVVVKNNILVTLKNNITKTVEFINNNLKVACDLSIGSLLPTVLKIKTEDEILQSWKNELINLNDTRSIIASALASTNHYIVDENGNKKTNPRWNALKEDLDSINGKIGQLQTDIGNQIEKLTTLCREANSIISSILALNGNLAVNKANLPDYTLIPIEDLSAYEFKIEDVSNELEEPITFEKILADSKFPFKIIEKSYIETDDGGYRFQFTYNNNGVTEKGFMMVPGNANKKYENIFAFYSGSGGLDRYKINRFFHATDANPEFPVITFSRNSEHRSDEEINTTIAAIEDFKAYFGTNNAKIHAIGNSRGAQELNQIVAEKPSCFTSATIINGNIKFNDPEMINSYQNAQTKINIFVGTADSNIKPKEQLEDYCHTVNMTTNYHYLPLGENQKFIFDNNKGKDLFTDYRPIEFDQLDKMTFENSNSTESIFPKSVKKISEYFNGETFKQADTHGKMDLYFLDGAGHANGTLTACLGDKQFYDLIINTLE